MKISEYIAALTANGLTEDAARGLAKGQATALSLVDDIGLTMPLASGLVKGLVTGGLSEATATEAARVAIAKGDAVDDLVVQAAEPVTADDAVSQLEAASAELLKGKKAQVEMDLNGDEEDDDEDGEDGDDDGKPDGLDGDDRGKPDTMPAKANGGGKYGKTMKGAVVDASVMAQAVQTIGDRLDAKFADLTAHLVGIAKGVGAQGNAQAAALRAIQSSTEAVQALAKGFGEPRHPRGATNTADVEFIPHPSETASGTKRTVDRATLRSQALVKGQLEPGTAAECAALATMIIDGADDATVQAAATKLGLA